MITEVTLAIKTDKGTKSFILDKTAEATPNKKTGKMSLAHYQPKEGNEIMPRYSPSMNTTYVDTVKLEAEFTKEAKAAKEIKTKKS